MIALSSELECEIVKYDCDDEGRMQILSLNYENEKFLLVNIYNENTEQKQIDLIIKLLTKLENFGELGDHKLIFGGDWNFIFNIDLDANRGSPTLKRKTIAEVIKLSEKYDLLDIFRIRNPEKRRFSFRQPTPKLQRRLDFFLISNELQESVKKIEIIASLNSDHSPVLLCLDSLTENERGPNFWKFNSSLLKDAVFCEKSLTKLEELKNEYSSSGKQKKWELIKYEQRKLAIAHAKSVAKQKREKMQSLELIVRDFESMSESDCAVSENSYLDAKNELETLHTQKIEGQMLRAKCQWYEDGKKSSRYFLSHEKNNTLNRIM